MARETHSGSLPVATGIGYGFGAFGLMLFNLTVSIFLLYFYTDVVGLPASTAGYIILVAMLWDAVTDPLMGIVADRTRTRWGHYRPYLAFATPLLFLAFVGVFAQATVDILSMVAYALAATLIYRTAFTAVYMPYTSMIAAITSDYRARSTLTGYKTFFVSIAGIIVSASVLFLVEMLGRGNEAKGFAGAALVMGALAVSGIWICFATTRETSNTARQDTRRYSLAGILRVTAFNGPFIQVFVASFLLLVGWNCLWQSIVYYFKYVIGDANGASIALTGFHIAQALAAIGWAAATRNLSKRNIWIAGALVSIAAMLALYLAPQPTPATAITLVTVFGVGTSAFLVTFYSALADTVDYGEYHFGVRCEALVFGILAFATKASFGAASGLVGSSLERLGFDANGQQSAAVITGIESIFTLYPVAGFLLSVLVIAFYRIDAGRHAALVSALNERVNRPVPNESAE